MEKSNNTRPARSYVIEAAVAIAFAYFLFGGAEWSPAAWAIFAVVAIWIVVMNVRRDAGVGSSDEYERYRVGLGFLFVLVLVVGAIYQGSLWLFILSLFLGVIWAGDFRRLRHSR